MIELVLQTTDGDGNGGFVLAAFLGWLILGIVQLILFVAALVSILSSKRYTGGGKLLWVVVVFFAPLLGALGWFIVGRRAQIRTSAP